MSLLQDAKDKAKMAAKRMIVFFIFVLFRNCKNTKNNLNNMFFFFMSEFIVNFARFFEL